MRITSKGQVTIPQDIRESAGLLPHTEVEFVIHGNKVWICKKTNKLSRGAALIRQMTGKATVKLTTDEIMALMR